MFKEQAKSSTLSGAGLRNIHRLLRRESIGKI